MLLQMESMRLKIIMSTKGLFQEDKSNRTDVRKIKASEVGTNLRLIADEIHAEYTKYSLGKVLWLQIYGVFRRACL